MTDEHLLPPEDIPPRFDEAYAELLSRLAMEAATKVGPAIYGGSWKLARQHQVNARQLYIATVSLIAARLIATDSIEADNLMALARTQREDMDRQRNFRSN